MIRRELLPLALANSAKLSAVDAYADVVGMSAENGGGGMEEEGKAWGAEETEQKKREREPAECIIDIREHDIPYYLRVAIDLGECAPSSGALDQKEGGRSHQTSESVCGTPSHPALA